MLLQVAWKNIWRNKIRSLVILVAIALGIFAGVFSMGFYKGMAEQRVKTAISTEASHIQIHQKEYLTDPDSKVFIPNVNDITSYLNSQEFVKHSSARVIVNSMITSAETGSGVKLVGIIAADEKQVTDISTRLTDGEYLEGIKRNPILIGEKLAEKLNIKIRSKVVLTLQNLEGEMMYASFRVAGIFKTSNTMYDESTAFVRQKDIAVLISLDPSAGHEIAILLNSNEAMEVTLDHLTEKYSTLDVKSWKEIMPEVALVEQTMDIPMYIFMGVILFALLFGIINTMLMAVLERRKELGMLMAIGMNKIRVFKMIMLETVMLSLTGGLVGIVLGALITIIASRQGIDLSATGQAYESLGYDPLVYPVFKISMAVTVTIMVIFTGFLGSLYPARKALKLKPADAIRIDM